MGILKFVLIKVFKLDWGKVIPYLLRMWAEGELGLPARKIYWFLAGKKTVLGAAFIGVGTAADAICSSYPEFSWACPIGKYIFLAGTFLVPVGLIDGGVRSPWPNGTPKETK